MKSHCVDGLAICCYSQGSFSWIRNIAKLDLESKRKIKAFTGRVWSDPKDSGTGTCVKSQQSIPPAYKFLRNHWQLSCPVPGSALVLHHPPVFLPCPIFLPPGSILLSLWVWFLRTVSSKNTHSYSSSTMLPRSAIRMKPLVLSLSLTPVLSLSLSHHFRE